MIINQSLDRASVDIRGAACLPDAAGGTVVADEADNTKDELLKRRSRKMTEQGKSFRLSALKERRENINAHLQRKSSRIEDLLFSK